MRTQFNRKPPRKLGRLRRDRVPGAEARDSGLAAGGRVSARAADIFIVVRKVVEDLQIGYQYAHRDPTTHARQTPS